MGLHTQLIATVVVLTVGIIRLYAQGEEPGPVPIPVPGCASRIGVAAFSTSPADADVAVARDEFRILRDAFSATPATKREAELLEGLDSVAGFISDLLGTNLLAVAAIDDREDPRIRIDAVANGCGSGIPDGAAAIIFNRTGSYFDKKLVTPATESFEFHRGVTMIHEVCHFLGDNCQADYNMTPLSHKNDDFVRQHFKNTLSAFVKAHNPGAPASGKASAPARRQK